MMPEPRIFVSDSQKGLENRIDMLLEGGASAPRMLPTPTSGSLSRFWHRGVPCRFWRDPVLFMARFDCCLETH